MIFTHFSGGPVPREGRTLEEVACARYRRKSGEEALLGHKLKQKRCTASLEYFLKKDAHKAHNQYLIKHHHRLSHSPSHCNNHGCDNNCLPFSSKCSRRIPCKSDWARLGLSGGEEVDRISVPRYIRG